MEKLPPCKYCGSAARPYGHEPGGLRRARCSCCKRTMVIGGPGRGANQIEPGRVEEFLRLAFSELQPIKAAAKAAGISPGTARKLYWQQRAKLKLKALAARA